MKRILVIALGLSVAGLGIWYYIKTQAELLAKFKYKITGGRLNTVSTNVFQLSLFIKFSSIADIEATVSDLSLNVFLDDKKVGVISNDNSFIIPSHGTSDIALNLSFDPRIVLGNILDIVSGNRAVENSQLKIDGYASVKSGFISATLPVRYSTSIKEFLATKQK